MRNAFKFAVLAVMLFLVQFSFADTIPTEGQWNEEDYYRSVNTNRPPVAYQVVLLHRLGHLTGSFTLE